MEWGGNGEGMGRERSVHEQPVDKVDGIAPHKRRDSKKITGNWQGNWPKGAARGYQQGVRLHLILLICIYVSYHV
jgi:hypothetical protein